MINYYLLTKPGIILGNLITVAAGFLLASRGVFQIELFLATLLGLACIIASACVFNNYIDRPIDKKMERTKNRALVTGVISGKNAICLGLALAALGNAILFFYTNMLTLLAANAGFFIYVVLYSLWKGRTIYGTAIGSIAGALPPVIGYLAVSNRVDLGALILFAMLVFWQMPHFFSIVLLNFDDYAKADIPVLPVKKGILRTKIHMALYILAFILIAISLTFYNYTGYLYLVVTVCMGLIWLALCMKGFWSKNDKLWGGRMFRLSLFLITATCLVMGIDTV